MHSDQGPGRKNPPRTHPLCSKLARHRLAHRITQVATARKIGIHRTMLAHWEGGRHTPSLKNFVDWANAIGVEIKLEVRT